MKNKRRFSPKVKDEVTEHFNRYYQSDHHKRLMAIAQKIKDDPGFQKDLKEFRKKYPYYMNDVRYYTEKKFTEAKIKEMFKARAEFYKKHKILFLKSDIPIDSPDMMSASSDDDTPYVAEFVHILAEPIHAPKYIKIIISKEATQTDYEYAVNEAWKMKGILLGDATERVPTNTFARKRKASKAIIEQERKKTYKAVCDLSRKNPKNALKEIFGIVAQDDFNGAYSNATIARRYYEMKRRYKK